MGQIIINKNLDNSSIISSNYLIDDLQKEVKFLKQQMKYIKQREKKRSWKKYGRRF